MKTKSLLLSILFFMNIFLAGAANFKFLPYTIQQPDGAVIQCFVSGDEYFNWLHDKDGYTIIQASDGYYYWGETKGDAVVPTAFRADQADPAAAGMKKWAKISLSAYQARKAFYAENTDHSVRAPHTGTMNNLAVYIRFADDAEFTTTRQTYDNKFNAPTGKSLQSYYAEVSYQTFTISTSHYPECALITNLSYQDYHPRSYFQPYNVVTNPGGYNGDTARRGREHRLLRDVVDWINLNSPVSPALNIDGDNDGRVDNVCFIIRGGNGAWAELLWAHRWSLFSYEVFINGKRVWDYTFQPETQVDVTTLCHEMFHALGSPDLYHYSSDGREPVGDWDLMESGSGHMGAYMKWKYTENSWIDSIPTIRTTGTYTLHPLTSATNNCYRIVSPYSADQHFILEYRRKTGTYENNIPASGLLVYRIDPSVTGNASGPPDEVYIYRPGGTPSVNGTTGAANFSAESHRTKINDHTNPSSFLQNGSIGGLDIFGVTSADSTISFNVNIIDLDDPAMFSATAVSTSEILLKWQKNGAGKPVMIAFDTTSLFGTPVNGSVYTNGSPLPGGGVVICQGADTSFMQTELVTNKRYWFKAWSVLPGNTYSAGLLRNVRTLCEPVTTLPFSEGFENSSDRPACWFEDNSDPAWQFIAGNGLGSMLGYPASAHSGLRNACLVDATQTSDTNTLIMPMMDVSGYSNIQLSFWLFKQKWGSRQDELNVYYRTNPALPWILLQNYNQSVSSWTQQFVSLPQGLTSLQIGFEGIARWALGICIDDIEVTGIPLPLLNVTPLNQDVPMEAGQTTFTVDSQVPWSAASDALAWCTVTPSGNAGSVVTATFTQNSNTTARLAHLLITSPGFTGQTVTITQAPSNGIAEQAPHTLLIYPNPAKDLCRIEHLDISINGIELFDLTGRLVLRHNGMSSKAIDLDLRWVSPGAYLLRIQLENKATICRKINVIR